MQDPRVLSHFYGWRFDNEPGVFGRTLLAKHNQELVCMSLDYEHLLISCQKTHSCSTSDNVSRAIRLILCLMARGVVEGEHIHFPCQEDCETQYTNFSH